ncbi:hypothetical protein C1J01_09905 [Nonomuraea aridisoli]|uniref:Penicillin-binding protein n=1 Tax=Nonomuraea aridisoli TaxID=2070368 RepID=A0A2W2F5A5_9ACTN|nr:hypothetical protein C1J01_09905 [Nonomuraea aridisoli]
MAVAVVLAGSAVLVPRLVSGAEPARDHLAVAAVRPSVLVDVQGAVIEEFTGDCAASRNAYLCERVRAELSASDATLVRRGDLTIRTAIDPRVQRAVEQAVERHVDPGDEPVAAQAVIAPGTGEIKALATRGGHPGGAHHSSGVQQGTSAMVYPLAAALESGMRLDDGLSTGDGYQAPAYASFKNCAGESVGDPTHTVVNRTDDGAAFTTLRSGTVAAENTFFMKLTETVGLCESVKMAQRLGLARADGAPLQEYETFALGVNEVDAVAVASSYATLAARGRHCAPRVVTEVIADGGVVRAFPPACEQELEAPVADAVTAVLAQALAASPLEGLGRDAAGMDGTADAFTAAGYAGYTPDLASAVSLGFPSGGVRRTLTDVTIGGRRHQEVSGTDVAGAIWKESMRAALAGTPETPFTALDETRFGGCRKACPPG